MKKITFILAVIALCSFEAFSQAAVDINDSFYEEAQRWEMQGLTSSLPLLRPYPLSVIERVLNDVISRGNKNESSLAEEEYERIFSKPYTAYAKGSTNIKQSSADKDDNKNVKDISGEIGVGGDIRLHDLVSFGYKLGIYGETDDFDSYSPVYQNILEDSIYDKVDAGPFNAYLNWNTNLSAGTSSVWATAGLSRVGFGPFYGEGLALNDTGYHSANLIVNASGRNFSYASVYEIIGATRNIPDGELNDGKNLAFHALRWNAYRKFNVTYYENIIFGPNSNLSYFFPAPYYAMQNIGGANDNLQMGLLFEVKPFRGFNWATDFFADDMELNDILKLDFDTKLRFGFQTGVIYTPESTVINKVKLNYTAIMPYVYAHWEYDDDDSGTFTGSTWNYQNYTNAGINIGSTLDPNSDRISFAMNIKPVKKLSLDLSLGLTRHANSAEDFSDEEAIEYMLSDSGTYSTDGTSSMSQMFSSDGDGGRHVSSAWEKLGFMTGSHKMYVLQAGLNAEYELSRTKYGSLSFKIGYMFEYIKNAGVNSNIYSGGCTDYYYEDDDDGNRTYYEKTGEKKDTTVDKEVSESEVYSAVVAPAKQAWLDSLYNCTNHYLSIGFKYTY